MNHNSHYQTDNPFIGRIETINQFIGRIETVSISTTDHSQPDRERVLRQQNRFCTLNWHDLCERSLVSLKSFVFARRY